MVTDSQAINKGIPKAMDAGALPPLPGYSFGEILHHSSRTTVFRGRRLSDDLAVIIKIPSEHFAAGYSGKLFRRELSLGKLFDCQEIIHYHDVVDYQGGTALIEEDFGAVALREIIPRNGLPLSEFFDMAIRLAAGLAMIHRQNVVHKNIKPNNIVVNRRTGHLKYIDFSISSVLRREFQSETSEIEGTLAYVSPEQTGRMNRPLDYRTDFYSLGITLFELVTGRLPFTATDSLALIHQHIALVPPKAHEIRKDVPSSLSAILSRLLEKDAEARYQSALGLKVDLERCSRFFKLGRKEEIFPLATMDFSDRLTIPSRLYGREAPLATLLAAFERSARGMAELFLVSGPSGIGKSVLVREIHRSVTACRGCFISGKFDELNRDLAYSAVREAITELMRRVLGESDEEVARRGNHLRAILGPEGRQLSAMIPQVAPLLGEADLEVPAEPGEAPNRFRLILRDFIAAMATKESPVVMFLDDLQWADAATLELLEILLAGGAHFLLIGAYRDQLVENIQPLMKSLAVLEKKRVRTTRIRLNPLAAKDLKALLADSLKTEQRLVAPLASLVAGKTGGNPFYTYELLMEMNRRGVLCFSRPKTRWVWDLAAAAKIDARKNVVDFMVHRLELLGEDTRAALRFATCLGHEFDLDTLAHLLEKSTFAAARDLDEALREEILIPLDKDYRLVDLDFGQETPKVRYRFQHDRVRQAAYALVKESGKPALHLAVGRALQRLWRDRDDKLLDLVGHLNMGGALIRDPHERRELAEMNLAAGRKTLASAAYVAAAIYFQTGLSLLKPKPWVLDYGLAFALGFHNLEVAILLAEFTRAASQTRSLMRVARTDLERARVINAVLDPNTEDPLKVKKAANRGLRYLGISLPKKPGRALVQIKLAQVRATLRECNISDLRELAPLKEPWVRTAMNLLGKLIVASYYSGNRNLWSLGIIERIRLSLIHGLSPEAGTAFATFGDLLGSEAGDYKAGEELGRLAVSLAEHNPYGTPRSKILFVYGMLIHHWQNHWRHIPSFLKQAIEAGLHSGDTVFAQLSCDQVGHWDPTTTMEESVLETGKYQALLESRFPGRSGRSPFLQYHLCLQGLTKGPFSFSDGAFDEDAYTVQMGKLGFKSQLCWFKLLKIEVYFIYGEYRQAMDLLVKIDADRNALKGTPSSVEWCFFSFLVYANLLESFSPPEQVTAWRRLRTEYRTMSEWARQCPVNFEHRRLLMEAEMGRLKGVANAANLYNAAVEEAAKGEWRQHEAISYKLAAHYYIARGLNRIATCMMTEAMWGFASWGANQVVTFIRETYPRLLGRIHETRLPGPASNLTEPKYFAKTGGTLDLASVFKSSSAMISEIEYDKLLARMMRIIIENTGAQKGALVLNREDELCLEVTAELGNQNESRYPSRPLDQCLQLPRKLVRYVFRAGEHRVMAYAAGDSLFRDDPYIREHGVKSVLCMPIRYKERTTGVLYLENNLVEGAFTEERVALLQLLSAQAAISLENAGLFAETRRLNKDLARLNEELEQRVVERTAQLEEAQKELVSRAHNAGMAEIATSVLHNVGNILNSVLTSCQLIRSCVENSKTVGLSQANVVLRENIDRIEDFIINDTRGKKLLEYYLRLDDHLEWERTLLQDNISRLANKVEAIREVVVAQQSFASLGDQSEELQLAEAVDDALAIYGPALRSFGVTVEKHFDVIPAMFLPKNKLIHVFINLIKNAAEAVAGLNERKIILAIEGDLEWALVRITDTGMGIKEANRGKVFNHGFTTKSKGHGFGLHACANAMTEMGGSIRLEDETGKRTCFVLRFPV